MDLRLRAVTVPVSDVDRAKACRVERVGFSVDRSSGRRCSPFRRADAPGPSARIAGQTGYMDSVAGSITGMQPTSTMSSGSTHSFGDKASTCRAWRTIDGRFCFFSTPDGNGWSVHGPVL